MQISVSTDIHRLKVKMFELRSAVLDKAIPSALNKTAVSARAGAVKEIRKKLKRMKAARIRARITIVRATRSVKQAVIIGRRVKVPPGAFKLPGHGDTLYIRVGKKHRMITSKSGRSAGKRISSGYQVAPIQSLQVIEEYGKSYVTDKMTAIVRERFPVVFERDLRHFASRVR